MYKILHKLFGWDYVYWHNLVDNGIARIHTTPDGVSYYWRYKLTNVLDLVEPNTRIIYLTCNKSKYIKYLK